MPGILPKTAKLIDLRNAKSVLTFESLFENGEEVEEYRYMAYSPSLHLFSYH